MRKAKLYVSYINFRQYVKFYSLTFTQKIFGRNKKDSKPIYSTYGYPFEL